MPHYDYQCSNCGHQLKEIFQKITEQPHTNCPQCQKNTLKRGHGGGIGLVFQGSGFYSTDYASKQPADKPQSDPPSSCCPCGKSSCS